jgi:hypothetical protein
MKLKKKFKISSYNFKELLVELKLREITYQKILFPDFTDDVEWDMVTWIVGMQHTYPVSQEMILVKANETFWELYNWTKSTGCLKKGRLN